MKDIVKLFLLLGALSILGMGFLAIVWFFLNGGKKDKLRIVTRAFPKSPLGKRLTFHLFIALGLAISLASATLFIGITGLLFTEDDLVEFDLLVVHFVSIFRFDALTSVFEAITFLGDSMAVIGILAISVMVGLIRHKWVSVLLLITSAAGSQFFVFFMKQFIARSRPSTVYSVIEAGGYSFPSGHAAVAMALYGLLWYIIFRALPNQSLRLIWTIIFTFLIGGIAISRVYLGVHYPSDILAGLAFGAAWTTFLIVGYEIWSNSHKRA